MSSGTFNLWINSEKNPDAFAVGHRQRWARFKVGQEDCVVASDGNQLEVTAATEDDQPKTLIRIPVVLPKNRRRHLITFGWSKGSMKVILDAKVLAQVPITFVLWAAFVGWTLFSRCHW